MPEPVTPYFLTDAEAQQIRLLITAAAMGVPYTVGDTIALVEVGAAFGVDVSRIERMLP